MFNAIETTATVDERHQLILDEDLPLKVNERVKVIVLAEQSEPEQSPVYRKAGSAAGLIKMSEDFNESLEDFKDYMP